MTRAVVACLADGAPHDDVDGDSRVGAYADDVDDDVDDD